MLKNPSNKTIALTKTVLEADLNVRIVLSWPARLSTRSADGTLQVRLQSFGHSVSSLCRISSACRQDAIDRLLLVD